MTAVSAKSGIAKPGDAKPGDAKAVDAKTGTATSEAAQASPGAGGPPAAPPQAPGRRRKPALTPEETGIIPALRHVARGYRLMLSEQTIRAQINWSSPTSLTESLALVAGKMGLVLTPAEIGVETLGNASLPMVCILPGGDTLVIEAISRERVARYWLYAGQKRDSNEKPLADLLPPGAQLWAVRPNRSLPDARIDAYIAPVRPNWLRETLFPNLRPYGPLAVASLVVNMLALAGVLFSMQVYDRVIPARSLNTLGVLFGGVALAFLFDFLLRLTRSHLVDILGKHAGLRLSERVFGRALRIRNEHRPASTGSFIAQIRDIDTMRESLTSSSVNALLDIPFFLLFLVLYWYMAGWMVAVPLTAFVLMVTPGVVLQPKLRAAAQAAQRESALRNATLVETIQGLEDIKGLQAEERFETVWRETSLATAGSQMRQKQLTSWLVTWSQIVQQGVYAGTVAVGAPLVMSGDITTGTLVAASILGSRMVAPMGQVTSVLSRLQQARVGAQGLNQLMNLPIDAPEEESRIALPHVAGDFTLEKTGFRYRPGMPVALNVARLQIRAGERIALLGRNGAGKSTLLQALSGQLLPSEGKMLIDGLSAEVIDPADLRRDIACLSQNARLFFGSLRENIALGQPRATDDEILSVLALAGGESLPNVLPNGLDYQIAEGGAGLSGGQRQTILLARLLIRNPSVLLLDEPTAFMDDSAEKVFVENLERICAGRTLILATHRLRILSAVERIVVVDHGKIALDGPKDVILAKLRGGANG